MTKRRVKSECEASLAAFIKRAWPIIEPGQPYVHGWHIDAICEHLEAITAGEINRLLINIPPGTMKSLAVGVFWPAWEWGPKGRPSTRVVAASHEQGLAVRDNLRARRLIASDWYQSLWGESVVLTKDQNAKIKFENEATGFRQAAAAGSITGARGDRVIIDDPHSVDGASSDAQRESVVQWFMEAVPTRLNNPDRSAIVVVMQRLHEKDVSGSILSRDLGYEHLCLPMEFEPERACRTSIGFTDPRKVDGELLFPARFPRDVVDRDKKVMGSYAVAGQFQQRPAPREGGMFKRSWFQVMHALPSDANRQCRAWDFAATEGGGDYTAGVKMAATPDRRFIITDVRRGQWGPASVERELRLMAASDGTACKIRIPQDPGAAGKVDAQSKTKLLSGYSVKSAPVTGDKEQRAGPLAAQAEAGNVFILATGDPVRDAWIEPFLDEVCVFPAGAHDDQVDAVADAFNELALGSNYNLENV